MIATAPKIAQIQPAILCKDNQLIITIEVADLQNNQYYALKVIDSYNNKQIGDVICTSPVSGVLQFHDNDQLYKNLIINNFYKLQLAYSTNSIGSELSAYSNIGVAKCIEPVDALLSVVNSSEGLFQFSLDNTNKYEQIKTIEFIFHIYDNTRKCVEKVHTSGIINGQNSTTIEYVLPYNYSCYNNTNQRETQRWLGVDCVYTTTSGYQNTKSLQDLELIELPVEKAKPQQDIGIIMDDYQYVILSEQGKITTQADYNIVYKYNRHITSKNVNDVIIEWVRYNSQQDRNLFSYGETQYILQSKYNASNQYLTDKIIVDFEDSFLFDENYDYVLKFNPKVSNFKEVRQEQKIETIGSQYPFIYRNEAIKYKEFQLGGLISRLGNISNEDMDFIYDTNLTSENIAAERQYKITILEWLNNGKPKVFKSPTEGNYIIRLMNISLTPEEKLGRMLHSFTATAIEIAEYNYNNLKKYNLL